MRDPILVRAYLTCTSGDQFAVWRMAKAPDGLERPGPGSPLADTRRGAEDIEMKWNGDMNLAFPHRDIRSCQELNSKKKHMG